MQEERDAKEQLHLARLKQARVEAHQERIALRQKMKKLNYFNFLKSMPYKQAAGIAYFTFWGLYVVYSWAGFKRKSYCYRAHDVIYNFGVFHKTTVLIPFNRIQHIALHQGLFSRKFGLASLQFYTAGGSTTDIRIPGIPLEIAKSFKETISYKIEK